MNEDIRETDRKRDEQDEPSVSRIESMLDHLYSARQGQARRPRDADWTEDRTAPAIDQRLRSDPELAALYSDLSNLLTRLDDLLIPEGHTAAAPESGMSTSDAAAIVEQALISSDEAMSRHHPPAIRTHDNGFSSHAPTFYRPDKAARSMNERRTSSLWRQSWREHWRSLSAAAALVAVLVALTALTARFEYSAGRIIISFGAGAAPIMPADPPHPPLSTANRAGAHGAPTALSSASLQTMDTRYLFDAVQGLVIERLADWQNAQDQQYDALLRAIATLRAQDREHLNQIVQDIMIRQQQDTARTNNALNSVIQLVASDHAPAP